MTPSLPPIAPSIIPYGASAQKPPVPHRPFTDPNRLAPEDAFLAHSPPRRQQSYSQLDGDAVGADIPSLRGTGTRRRRGKDGGRSGSRRGMRVWKKLLWVNQREYPDNYTDPPTFLSHLQRNPRLRPYDFWPLVADSTVIVQHISAVAIFICSFVGLYQQRVSPVTVVGLGSAGTALGWVLWDFWVGQNSFSKPPREPPPPFLPPFPGNTDFLTSSALSSPTSTTAPTPSSQSSTSRSIGLGLGLSLTTTNLATTTTTTTTTTHPHTHSISQTSLSSAGPSPTLSYHPSHSFLTHPSTTLYATPRTHQRLATIKSAILITIALLGLSPILKSLTKSTSPDSIWAMSCWLLAINMFFFDYSGVSVDEVKFPASLSTNAAVMASTVLASRLPSTTHVFSLTLFSIEVFGLFPVFRRHLRHVSWRGHLLLTLVLVVGAGAGAGLVMSGKAFLRGGWKRAVAGAGVWVLGSVVGMGGCSWWFIGLQRYKNVVIGPWDPARPIIRGGWDRVEVA